MTADVAVRSTADLEVEACSILAADLAEALHNGILFTGGDDTLPLLTCVRLESDGGALTAVSTDRYCLGATTVPYTGPALAHNLRGRDAAELVGLLRMRARRASTVGMPVIVDVAGQVLTFTFGGMVVSYEGFDQAGEFPKWRSLIPVGEPTDTNMRAAFNPALLSRFGRVIASSNHMPSKHTPMRMHLGGQNRPLVAKIGDRFVGVIMPIRFEEWNEVTK